MASMAQMSEFVQKTEGDLFRKLEAFTADESVCDLGEWLHYFAFDVGSLEASISDNATEKLIAIM